MSKKTVAVGLSGGVDSAVSAYLLKQQGYNVFGIFMKNWEDDEFCPAQKDYEDVIQVCQQLDIPFYTVNFAKEYWDLVFQNLLSGLKLGLTPNPDILCNKYIKFDALMKKALSIGADYLATGHYADVAQDSNGFHLKKSFDSAKDQTYFLYTLKSEILEKVLFPLASLQKSEVRQIAKEQNLVNHAKKDSTGICFIGKRDFKSFVEEYIPHKKGLIVSVDGAVLGEHDGISYYTIGQRKGLGIGGPGSAWFVAEKNIERNEVILAQGEEHPALYSHTLTALSPSWVTNPPELFPFHCMAKIRYRQPEQECWIEKMDEESLTVRFAAPQRAITPSQSIVFYQNNLCIGGAIIKESGPSLWSS